MNISLMKMELYVKTNVQTNVQTNVYLKEQNETVYDTNDEKRNG